MQFVEPNFNVNFPNQHLTSYCVDLSVYYNRLLRIRLDLTTHQNNLFKALYRSDVLYHYC